MNLPIRQSKPQITISAVQCIRKLFSFFPIQMTSSWRYCSHEFNIIIEDEEVLHNSGLRAHGQPSGNTANTPCKSNHSKVLRRCCKKFFPIVTRGLQIEINLFNKFHRWGKTLRGSVTVCDCSMSLLLYLVIGSGSMKVMHSECGCTLFAL